MHNSPDISDILSRLDNAHSNLHSATSALHRVSLELSMYQKTCQHTFLPEDTVYSKGMKCTICQYRKVIKPLEPSEFDVPLF
jgi:hypothetical protein